MTRYALISVYDKSGLLDFARALQQAGFALLSTGGTHRELTRAGIETLSVEEFTGAPEILNGRVKTLHPKIYAGLLYRRELDEHAQQLAEHGYSDISVVVCNLYPFAETIQQAGVTVEAALEQMDIGGVTLIRAAAKSFQSVTVVTAPADYQRVSALIESGELSTAERRALAAQAVRYTSEYDAQIATYLSGEAQPNTADVSKKVIKLRYGENPHQSAELTADGSAYGIANAVRLHGGDMSYTNYLDADAAFGAVSSFADTAVVIVKHATPCGMAVGQSQADAFAAAYECDPTSAYGGIVAFNRPLTAAAAEQLRGKFFEIVIAPDFEAGVLDRLSKSKKMRVLRATAAPAGAATESLRSVSHGILTQSCAAGAAEPTLSQPGAVQPTPAQLADLKFAYQCVRFVKSNAIVIAADSATVGIGTGQPNRVGSVRLALAQAGDKAQNAVLASDAFFPFRDSIDMVAKAGISAVIQPAGSIRDSEVIAAADEHGIALVFTDKRQFLH